MHQRKAVSNDNFPGALFLHRFKWWPAESLHHQWKVPSGHTFCSWGTHPPGHTTLWPRCVTTLCAQVIYHQTHLWLDNKAATWTFTVEAALLLPMRCSWWFHPGPNVWLLDDLLYFLCHCGPKCCLSKPYLALVGIKWPSSLVTNPKVWGATFVTEQGEALKRSSIYKVYSGTWREGR